MSIRELETEILKLAPAEQARLLHALARSLDEKEEAPLSNEELEKRWADFEGGKEAAVEASELRRRVKKRHGVI